MAEPDRRGGGGLSLRTLVIASAASLTAAMVTSRLFPPGTIYASALTPVIVAAVSEVLNRPANRVSEIRRERRSLILETQRERVLAGQASPLEGAPTFHGVERAGEPATNGNGDGIPYTVHGRRPLSRRILHPKVWIVTGMVAFAIAVAVLTLPELVFGGAVATSRQTTFFGGGGTPSRTKTETKTTTTPSGTQTTKTVTQTVPTPSQTQTTPTSTQTTPTTTGTNPAPSGGAPAPSTGSTTTPAPSGSAVPPAP